MPIELVEAIAVDLGPAVLAELYMEKLPSMSERDLSTAARNMATGRGISVDKSMALRGEPVTTVAHLSAGEALDRLKSLGLFVDSTAADEPADAEVVGLPEGEYEEPRASQSCAATDE